MGRYSTDYYKRNKLALDANNKKWAKKNPEKIREYQRRYKQKSPSTTSKEYYRTYYSINKEKLREYSLQTYKRLRTEFLSLYGGVCSCCSESIEEFLTIEHVHGQKGKKKETSASAYRKAIKAFPSDEYEILCMNCNHARGVYGMCPHQSSNNSIM